jgi:hypothetical protein
MKTRYAIGAVLAVLCLAVQVRAADRMATDEELQRMFDQKQYQACLQQSARVLALRGDAAKPYDPFVIHMRRGECYLNGSDAATAALAFNAALTAADTPAKADQARAMVVLLKNSRGLNYYARQAPNVPLNLVTAAMRKEAMRALLADLTATSANDLNAANQATSLPPIMRFIPQAHELHALEIAATGTDAQTRPMLLSLGERARVMIQEELRKVNADVSAIEQRANTLVASGNTVVTNVTAGASTDWFAADMRLGLTPDDRERLRGMIPYVGDIVETCLRGRQTAISFGADGQVWVPLADAAQQTLGRAQAVLAAD